MANATKILMFITVTLLVITSSLFLNTYFGSGSMIVSVFAQDSEDNVYTLRSKGYYAHQQGMNEQAIEYYDRVLAIDPNDVYALNGKGNSLTNLGRYQEAIEYYDRVLAIDPNDVYALNGKGNNIFNLERYL